MVPDSAVTEKQLVFRDKLRTIIAAKKPMTAATPTRPADRSTLPQDEQYGDYERVQVFSNKTKDDILIKKEIDDLVEKSPNFKVFYTLTRHDEANHGKWDGLVGRINFDMLKSCGFLDPSDDLFLDTCGPKGFGKSITGPLEELGYVKDEMYS